MFRRLTDESGVSLIQVALLLLVFMGLSMFVTDAGVVWLARGQAQNAADSGALAGATARAYDETDDPPLFDGATYQSAYKTARSYSVFGAQAGADVSYDCPMWYDAPIKRCVRVDVFRDGTHTSQTLPTFFANVFGLTDQYVHATATAHVGDGNHTECLKPWIIPDKYMEVTPPDDEFNGMDSYTAPGYTLDDIGTPVILKPGDPHDAASPSTYYEWGDASTYEEAIEGCEREVSLGDTITTLPGNRVGPTKMGVNALLVNGPVVVPIAMFSPVEWTNAARTTGTFELHVVNIMGIRITDIDGNGTVHGTIQALPGEYVSADPTATNTAAFLKIIELIQ